MFDFKPASRNELKEEYGRIADEIGNDRSLTRRELKYLTEMLMENEQVLAFASGNIEDGAFSRSIVLTDARLIFLDKGIFLGFEQTSIGIDKIGFVAGSIGILDGEITIGDGRGERKIRNVRKKVVVNFTNRLQQTMRDFSKSGPNIRTIP